MKHVFVTIVYLILFTLVCHIKCFSRYVIYIFINKFYNFLNMYLIVIVNSGMDIFNAYLLFVYIMCQLCFLSLSKLAMCDVYTSYPNDIVLSYSTLYLVGRK